MRSDKLKMCGIFGYVGKRKDSADIVLSGLKTLEYRGYDSWGVAVGEGKSIKIEKKVGKIGKATVNLPSRIDNFQQSHCGRRR